jgi:hypothetical protein
MDRDDGYDGDWEDPEQPDYDDDEEPCISCPHCGREILEESERCPYCEHYISKEDASYVRKPLWILIGVAACLYVVYRWIVPH